MLAVSTSPWKGRFWSLGCCGVMYLVTGLLVLQRGSMLGSGLRIPEFVAISLTATQAWVPLKTTDSYVYFWTSLSYSLCFLLLLHKQNFHFNNSKGACVDEEVTSQLFPPPWRRLLLCFLARQDSDSSKIIIFCFHKLHGSWCFVIAKRRSLIQPPFCSGILMVAEVPLKHNSKCCSPQISKSLMSTLLKVQNWNTILEK